MNNILSRECNSLNYLAICGDPGSWISFTLVGEALLSPAVGNARPVLRRVPSLKLILPNCSPRGLFSTSHGAGCPWPCQSILIKQPGINILVQNICFRFCLFNCSWGWAFYHMFIDCVSFFLVICLFLTFIEVLVFLLWVWIHLYIKDSDNFACLLQIIVKFLCSLPVSLFSCKR